MCSAAHSNNSIRANNFLSEPLTLMTSSNHSRSSSSGSSGSNKRVTFVEDDVSEVHTFEKSEEHKEDLYFQPHEYMRFYNDFQRDEYFKALTSWLPKKKHIGKMFSRNKSSSRRSSTGSISSTGSSNNSNSSNSDCSDENEIQVPQPQVCSNRFVDC